MNIIIMNKYAANSDFYQRSTHLAFNKNSTIFYLLNEAYIVEARVKIQTTQEKYITQFSKFQSIIFSKQQPMGNACCAQGSELRQYDPTKRRMIDIDPSTIEVNSINFQSSKLPTKHTIVDKLDTEAGRFKAQNLAARPSGDASQPKVINAQGLIYHGQWMNGIPHGKGELFYPDGSYYIGYFSKGIADGEGRFISPLGWIYEGQLENEQAQGKGRLYHKQLKYRYEGSWSGDLPNGTGQEIWQSKKISYEGEFLNGKKHGYGVYRTPEFEYRGIFNDNQYNSSGFIEYEKGGKYEGNFQNGKKNGKGIYTWPDGSYYEGYYKNDEKHGQGRYKSPDEVYWEGEWVNGKRQGVGVLTVGDKKFVGSWINDQPADSTQSQIKSRLYPEDSRLR